MKALYCHYFVTFRIQPLSEVYSGEWYGGYGTYLVLISLKINEFT